MALEKYLASVTVSDITFDIGTAVDRSTVIVQSNKNNIINTKYSLDVSRWVLLVTTTEVYISKQIMHLRNTSGYSFTIKH